MQLEERMNDVRGGESATATTAYPQRSPHLPSTPPHEPYFLLPPPLHLAPPNCDSFYLNNRVMLGKCYLRVKDKANAREWLTKALSMPVTDAEGKSDNAEAVAMLKQC